MATDKQIEANRLNALKSTGPRTPEGKTAVCRNAFKHGIFAEAPIIIGEDHTACEALRDDYLDRFHPAGPDEEALVANLINHSWLLARFRRIESRTWDMRLENPISNHPLVSAHIFGFKELEFLQRRTNSTNRQFHRDMELLLKLQAARKLVRGAPGKLSHQAIGAAPTTPDPVLQSNSAEPTGVPASTGALASPLSEIGFVPSHRQEPRNGPALHLPAPACWPPAATVGPNQLGDVA
jgi:hypothetical protein